DHRQPAHHFHRRPGDVLAGLGAHPRLRRHLDARHHDNSLYGLHHRPAAGGMVARRPENAESGGAARLQAAGLLEDGQRPHMKFLFKGVDFFPHDTRWKIIERRYIFIGLSWGLAMLAAVLLMTRGLNYGVDFKGGSLIEVQSKSGALDIGDLRTKLDKLGIGDV